MKLYFIYTYVMKMTLLFKTFVNSIGNGKNMTLCSSRGVVMFYFLMHKATMVSPSYVFINIIYIRV